MMRQFELVERVQAYNPSVDEELLNKAYVYAMTKHGTQQRQSGDPYFSHPLEVAGILTDLQLDEATIVVALLHDTIEDTSATREEIDEKFGTEIGSLVDGLTKISRLDLVSHKSKQADNFRKLLLAVAKDVRVLLVKLADRLHNMRTLSHMDEEKRRRIAQETLDIYAPLAGRMGIQEFCDEMEDIGFKILLPEAYDRVITELEKIEASQDGVVDEVEDKIKTLLNAHGLAATVSGRRKRPYSIFRKMEQKKLSFDQLSDIFGFRVIVETVPDCYRALGLIHTKWQVIPDRFKDYISTPKRNDYQSLHTAVRIKRHKVELQIRTPEMHRLAELGIAAHALYKENGKLVGGGNIESLQANSNAIAWLRSTVDQLSEAGSSEEFLENTKLALFQDQVFCFTPKGKLIMLPRGATLLDFAYEVHTDIGNSIINAKVNGQVSAMLTQPKNGDEIEILCGPSRTVVAGWEPLARTVKARAAIRRATRDARRQQLISLGKVLVDSEFRRAAQLPKDDHLMALVDHFGLSSKDDLWAQAGEGQLRSHDLRAALAPATSEPDQRFTEPPIASTEITEPVGHGDLVARPDREAPERETPDREAPSSSAGLIAIKGMKDEVLLTFAKPGGAVPGDRIIGVAKPGRGITIYPIQAEALKAFEDQPERWIEVKWDVEPGAHVCFSATLDLEVHNQTGVLADVATCIADNHANIDDLITTAKTEGLRNMRLELEVTDVKHLSRIMRALKQQETVCRVDRYFC